MRVADLLAVLERRAPAAYAESWDNVGLLVGDERAAVHRILATLELTPAVLDEAVEAGCDTVLTHHPLLFSPLRTLVESRARERLVRRVIAERVTVVSCHTNLDSAPGGIADIVGAALGLTDMRPLSMAQAGWFKLVGFIPADAVDAVAAAVFAAGGGGIGNYKECAFSGEGTGWFTPLPGSDPVIGEVSRPERTPEVRWETVVPKAHLSRAIRAFVEKHPYEEPAFDIYLVEDVVARAGLGRVGDLPQAATVAELAQNVRRVFDLERVSFSGEASRVVSRVGVLPGSGRGLVDEAQALCEVLISGDLSYHMGEQASERDFSLIDTPHGELEWWAFRRWAAEVGDELSARGVALSLSRAWRGPWTHVGASAPLSGGAGGQGGETAGGGGEAAGGRLRLWIDGGSRGNPGPSAIGVVVQDADGNVLETIGRVIGVGTNNVAEYRALLAGLNRAAALGAWEVEVASDSELLVRQMRGEYKVKNEGLVPLHREARDRAAGFCSFAIRHVDRAQNAQADALVNRALDEQKNTLDE